MHVWVSQLQRNVLKAPLCILRQRATSSVLKVECSGESDFMRNSAFDSPSLLIRFFAGAKSKTKAYAYNRLFCDNTYCLNVPPLDNRHFDNLSRKVRSDNFLNNIRSWPHIVSALLLLLTLMPTMEAQKQSRHSRLHRKATNQRLNRLTLLHGKHTLPY
ncbi:hypothetical protein D918_07666 [Trichuris suis]|nr:hypothetical protein D918_07666 [Trichuris suis]